MKKFHCENVGAVINFDEKQFNKKEFFKVFPKPRRNLNFFVVHLGSSNPKNPDHVHLELSLRKENSRLKAIFHTYEYKVEKLEEMTLETCVSWMSSFLKDYDYATIDASFEFCKEYVPVVQFDYPLLVNNEHLIGATVGGYSLNLPEESAVGGIHVIKGSEDVSVYVNGALESPKDFNFQKQLAILSPFAEALVVKTPKKDE